MKDEETIEVFETQIKELQAKIDAIKERKDVWTPKDGTWRLAPNLNPYFNDRVAGAGGTYATREDALAAVPLRYNQQMLEAYKREFDPTFKPKFDGSQANYYPVYNHSLWKIESSWTTQDPQLTYFSWGAGRGLVDKVNNGTVVLELGT